MKEIIVTGTTEEEAISSGLQQLGVSRENVEVETLEHATKKVLGLFGGNLAKVKLTVKEVEITTESYINAIVKALKVDGEVKLADKGDILEINIETEDAGILVGRRGETLDSIQYLAGLVENKGHDNYKKVTVDVANYREKRLEALKAMAQRTARNAIRKGRNIALEPMNPYERRIVHMAVGEVKGAKSWSVGSDENRHVIIGSESVKPRVRGDRPNKPKNDRGERDYSKERAQRSPRTFVSRSDDEKKTTFAYDNDDIVKEEKTLENNLPLYGKIDF